MNFPKVIAYTPEDVTNFNEEIGIPDEVQEEILAYSKKHNGYTMQGNSKQLLTFLGDEQDFIDIIASNDEKVKQKYNLAPEIISLTVGDNFINSYIGGCTVHAHVKKSDKLNLMPYGIYTFEKFEGFYPGFSPITVNLDEYVKFENSEVDTLQKTVIDFYRKRHIYEENKSRHKGASLMYGLPGCGKSSCLMNLISAEEFKDKYVIFIPKHMSFKYLESFKDAFAGHNTLIIMEEMTERLQNGTEDILNFLDGYSSWNNCYVIATTNYPEALPPNLVDRPGRFNHLVEVSLPTEEHKTYFLKCKGFSDEAIAIVLPKTKGFSMDYISRLVLESKLQELPLEDCILALENQKKKVKGTFKGKSSIGL